MVRRQQRASLEARPPMHPTARVSTAQAQACCDPDRRSPRQGGTRQPRRRPTGCAQAGAGRALRLLKPLPAGGAARLASEEQVRRFNEHMVATQAKAFFDAGGRRRPNPRYQEQAADFVPGVSNGELLDRMRWWFAEKSAGVIKTGIYHADVGDADKERLHKRWRSGQVQVV